MKNNQDQKLLEQYKELSKRQVDDNGDVIVIHQPKGPVLNLKYDVAIKTMKNYVLAKTGQNPKSSNFFKVTKQKQVKKVWEHISCSITSDEKKEFLAIAKKNEITVNELLRNIVLKVIESNK